MGCRWSSVQKESKTSKCSYCKKEWSLITSLAFHFKTQEKEQTRPKLSIMNNKGFPGGPVVKSPPAYAGDTGWIPGPGSLHVPQGSLAGAPWRPCSATREAAVRSSPHTTSRESPCSQELEKAHTATQTQHSRDEINNTLKAVKGRTPWDWKQKSSSRNEWDPGPVL